MGLHREKERRRFFMLDTLMYSKRLEAAGVAREQAEALSEALRAAGAEVEVR